MKHLSAAVLFLFGLASAALAQQSPGVSPVQCAFNTALPTIATGNFGYVQCDTNGRFIITGAVTATSPATGGGFPTGAIATTNTGTGTTGATIATLAAVAAKFTYICGFTISSDATAAIAGTATVVGTVGGTMSYIQNVGSATAAGVLSQTFAPCIPSSAVNTAIVITSVAAGTGGNTAVTAWGYQQ
jgi:hypothetical protein